MIGLLGAKADGKLLTLLTLTLKKQKKRFREVLKDEYEDSWLNEVLDNNLIPLDGLALEEYELTDDYLVVECAEYRGRTEVWIQKFNLV